MWPNACGPNLPGRYLSSRTARASHSMLLVDRWGPERLQDFQIHGVLARGLRNVAIAGDVPHVLLYGPPGAGKSCLMRAYLREQHGPRVDRRQVHSSPWKVSLPARSIEVDLTTISSDHHIEMTPSEAGYQDRFVVQEIVRTLAENATLDIGGGATFKTVCVRHVDRMSRDAQYIMLRTMEVHSSTCHMLLMCHNLSKVEEALKSRCLCMRVPAATPSEIEALTLAAGAPSPDLARHISTTCGRSMRRALLALEVALAEDTTTPPIPEWRQCIAAVARDIVQPPPNGKQVLFLRHKLYALLSNCVKASVATRILAEELYALVATDDTRRSIATAAAKYEQKMLEGSKEIFFFEAFVVEAMFLVHQESWDGVKRSPS